MEGASPNRSSGELVAHTTRSMSPASMPLISNAFRAASMPSERRFSGTVVVVVVPEPHLASLAMGDVNDALISWLAMGVAPEHMWAALEGMQMMGGMGYAVEGGMEEQLRATVVGTVVGGTSEVQRDIIAKTLGL